MAGGRLADWISLGVLASWVPADAVDEEIAATGKQVQRRGGKLPPRVTAYLVMALALFADEDYEEVAVRLAGTLADWMAGRSPGAGRRPRGIAQARQRLGPEPMAELFSQVARPGGDGGDGRGFPRAVAADQYRRDGLGHPGHPGERGRVRVPEAGKDGSAGAFPKAQVVTVSECASHAAVLAAIGPFALKRRRAGADSRLYPGLEEDWLLIADRGFKLAGLVHGGGHGGGAAVAVQVRHPASRAGDPSRRLLPVVLVTPKARAAARQELVEAARGGQEWTPQGPGTSASWSTRSPTGTARTN